MDKNPYHKLTNHAGLVQRGLRVGYAAHNPKKFCPKKMKITYRTICIVVLLTTGCASRDTVSRAMLEQWRDGGCEKSTQLGIPQETSILMSAKSKDEIKVFFGRNQTQELDVRSFQLLLIGWSSFSGRTGKHWFLYARNNVESSRQSDWNLVVYRYYEGENREIHLSQDDNTVFLMSGFGTKKKTVLSMPKETLKPLFY